MKGDSNDMPSTSDDLPAFPEEVLKACFCRLRLYEMQANSECLSLTSDEVMPELASNAVANSMQKIGTPRYLQQTLI